MSERTQRRKLPWFIRCIDLAKGKFRSYGDSDSSVCFELDLMNNRRTCN